MCLAIDPGCSIVVLLFREISGRLDRLLGPHSNEEVGIGVTLGGTRGFPVRRLQVGRSRIGIDVLDEPKLPAPAFDGGD